MYLHKTWAFHMRAEHSKCGCIMVSKFIVSFFRRSRKWRSTDKNEIEMVWSCTGWQGYWGQGGAADRCPSPQAVAHPPTHAWHHSPAASGTPATGSALQLNSSHTRHFSINDRQNLKSLQPNFQRTYSQEYVKKIKKFVVVASNHLNRSGIWITYITHAEE